MTDRERELAAEVETWKQRLEAATELIQLTDDWRSKAQAHVERLAAARKLVDVQAEDEGLWFPPQFITEEMLQTALRELHEIVEGKTPVECVVDVLERARERQP